MIGAAALVGSIEAQAVQASVTITVMPTIHCDNGEFYDDTHWTIVRGEGVHGHCSCSGECYKVNGGEVVDGKTVPTPTSDEEFFIHYIRGHWEFSCYGVKVCTIHVD